MQHQHIIIGAGPAGLMAALASKERCLILESKEKAGKKLLISGSGQCNFTHDLSVESFLDACGKFSHFLKPALYMLTPQDLMNLSEDLGCPYCIRNDGKVFPASLQAESLRQALLKELLKKGHKIQYQCKVMGVKHDDDFILKTSSGEEYKAEKLLICTGGKSWPQTGSDGSGHTLAKSLGHKIIPVRPALASIELNPNPFVECAGISLPEVSAQFISSKRSHKAKGDLLFTHKGLSGPLILDHVHHISARDHIKLNFLPQDSLSLRELVKSRTKTSIKNALKQTGLPERLLNLLLFMARIQPEKPCAEINKKELQALQEVFTNLTLQVGKIEGLATAMLSAGGVDLNQIRAKDMSSKLVEGLYFAGEVLDYNLPTGGYNIQAACSTGWLAGSSFSGSRI